MDQKGGNLAATSMTAAPTTVKEETKTGKTQAGTFFSSTVTLLSTVMGAGILSLPKAFALTGWGLGTIVMLVTALSADVSLQFLVQCARASGCSSYESNALHYLGPIAESCINYTMILLLFLCGVALSTIVKDLLPQFIADVSGQKDALYANEYLITVICLVCIIPLCLLDNLSSLSHSSTLMLICLAYFVVVLTVRMVEAPVEQHPGGKHPSVVFASSNMLDIFQGISIMVPAYLCHFNMISIDLELKASAKSSVGWVVHIAVALTSTFLYIWAGLAGYYLFGAGTESDILGMFKDDTAMEVAMFFMALTNLLKFPLLCLPLRESILVLLPAFCRDYTTIGTIILFPLLFGASCALKNLGIVLGILGCTGGVAICYVIPGLMYIQMQRVPPAGSALVGAGKSSLIGLAMATFLAVGGTVAGIVGLIAIISNWNDEK